VSSFGFPRSTGSFRARSVALACAIALAAAMAVPAMADTAGGVAPNAIGSLDCNGFSPIQKLVKRTNVCTDPRSVEDGVPARFEDNGHYIGHDEPSIRFLSDLPGSANDVTWNETLPLDPVALPTVGTPGSDVTHWFELSIAPWFGMALCDPYSFPQAACKPNSDVNAPKNPPTFDVGGGGSSFLEVQFYPPGFAPFVENISCDNTHWCASLHINDLECTSAFHHCNSNCIEPTNFGFIQRDGVPTGPPSPQLSNLDTFTPNGQTLLMNPGDRLSVHIFDAQLSGGGSALEVDVADATTGQRGFMQASAANGFMATNIGNCKGIPFNYEPEYNRALPQNIIPWAALEGGILTQYEIGHFTPCTSLSDPGVLDFGAFTDPVWQTCNGPYEADADADTPEGAGGDAPCFPFGDTHSGFASDPNLVTGCEDFASGGDIDFDGTSYWADWPNATSPTTFPSTFLQNQPLTGGHTYASVQFETDAAASESTCSPSTLSGCAVPAPGSPGNFYPYFTQASVGGTCEWEFGQMSNGSSFGGSRQYGSASAYFFGNLEGAIMPNPSC
jgi:hypothetical protein